MKIKTKKIDDHDESNKEEELDIKMQVAENYSESTIKMNVFNNLMDNYLKSIENSKTYNEYRKGYLMRACFVKWFENKSLLKEQDGGDNKDVFAYEGDLPTFRSINEEKVEKESDS